MKLSISNDSQLLAQGVTVDMLIFRLFKMLCEITTYQKILCRVTYIVLLTTERDPH